MSSPKNNLKKLRLAKKLSGVEVAGAVSITPQYFYELERGDKRLNEDLIRKLAEYFDCTTDYLLGKSIVRNPVDTIAAHHDGDEFTEEEMEDIEKFKEFVRSKREKKHS